MASRGDAVSGYLPCFAPAALSGAKVYGADIAPNAVTSAHIAPGTVVAGDIGDGSITSAKIGAGAVTSAKIGTGAVTATKLGADSVTSAKIATSAVTFSKMRVESVSGTFISAGVAQAIAHTLAVVPSLVQVVPLYAKADVLSGTTGIVIGQAAASAATSAVFYVIGNKSAVKFKAFLVL